MQLLEILKGAYKYMVTLCLWPRAGLHCHVHHIERMLVMDLLAPIDIYTIYTKQCAKCAQQAY